MTKFSFIKKVKLNKKFPFAMHVALLIAILMLLIMAVFAWFSSSGGKADANGISFHLGTGDSMDISLDGGKTFVNSIDLFSDEDQRIISESNKIKDKLNMEDITSDGKTFYRPVFNEENGQRIPNTAANWDYATQNRSYITETIIFRTDKKSDIFMGSGTQIITSCENDNKALASDNAADIGNKNSTYNFSNDCIVGALRISAVDSDGNICFVCIPRSDVELVRNGNVVEMKLGNNVSSEAKIHSYYSTNYQTDKGPVVAENVIYGFNGTQKIATTTFNADTGYYEATATVNIWLEGCDTETTRVLTGGKFKLAFNFIASPNNTPDPTTSEGIE